MARFGLPHPDKKEIIIPTEAEKWLNEHCIVIGTIQNNSGWCSDKYGMSKECILEMLNKIKNGELKLDTNKNENMSKRKLLSKEELMTMFGLDEAKFKEIVDVLENNKDIHSIQPPQKVNHWLFWYQYPAFKEDFLSVVSNNI